MGEVEGEGEGEAGPPGRSSNVLRTFAFSGLRLPKRGTVGLDSEMQRHFPQYTRVLISNARKLRREMTDPERKLWSLVRGKQLGVKMRRQVPIGRYIVDFLCEEKKLIIELDGSQHYTPDGVRRDKIRDDYLRTQGYTILRIDDIDMLKYPDSVLLEITSYLERDDNTEAARAGIE